VTVVSSEFFSSNAKLRILHCYRTGSASCAAVPTIACRIRRA